MRLDEPPQHGHGIVAAPLLRQSETETVLGVRGRRIDLHGGLEVRNRAVQIAEALQRDAEARVRDGKPGIQPDSFLQL